MCVFPNAQQLDRVSAVSLPTVCCPEITLGGLAGLAMAQLIALTDQCELPAIHLDFDLPFVGVHCVQGSRFEGDVFQQLIDVTGGKVGGGGFCHADILLLKPMRHCLNMPAAIREDYFTGEGEWMIDFNNKGFFKLKQNDEYAERVTALLLDGEQVIDAYKSMRDGVVFTNKRIIAVNVQGLTGSKKDFTSLPYKNIVAYSIETSGTFDLDSELEIYFSALGKVKFEFTGKTSMVEISKLISRHLLG